MPLATIGTVMPNGMEIGRRRVGRVVQRHVVLGFASWGWATTGRASSSCLRTAGVGTPFTEAMGLEPDVVYDLEVNPNRPDAMSIAGVARDLCSAGSACRSRS